MNAAQLIASVLDVYALAGTYRDVGQTLEYFRPVGDDSDCPPGVVEFRTAYARPDRLRFEDRHLHANGDCFAHNIVWAAGDDIRRWRRSNPEPVSVRSLQGALGMTVLNVHPVLALLTAGRVEGWLTNLTTPTLLDDAAIDGVTCYRVQSRCAWWDQEPTPEERAELAEGIKFLERVSGMRVPPGRTVHLPLTIWIDSRSLLIRRVESGRITDRATTESVVTCQPQINVALDPSELEFDPPV